MNDEELNRALLGSSLDFAKSINEAMLKIKNQNLFGVYDFSGFAKQMQLYQKNNSLNSLIGFSMFNNLEKALRPPKPVNPFLPLAGQIGQIAKQQEEILKNMTQLSTYNFSSNLLIGIEQVVKNSLPNISQSLSELAYIKKEKVFFEGTLNQYLTQSFELFIRDNYLSAKIDPIIEDLQDISVFLKNIQENQEITSKEIIRINDKLQKEGTSSFTYFIIQVLLAILLAFINLKPDKEKNVTININLEERKEIEKGFNKTLELLGSEQRTAICNVYLRTRPNMKAGKIGLVKKDQIVIVQIINHKWIYIVFQDEDCILKSGWAYKKYFLKTEKNYWHFE